MGNETIYLDGLLKKPARFFLFLCSRVMGYFFKVEDGFNQQVLIWYDFQFTCEQVWCIADVSIER